ATARKSWARRAEDQFRSTRNASAAARADALTSSAVASWKRTFPGSPVLGFTAVNVFEPRALSFPAMRLDPVTLIKGLATPPCAKHRQGRNVQPPCMLPGGQELVI